jgi:glycosyltransferase involved in cell wall biosynthesis
MNINLPIPVPPKPLSQNEIMQKWKGSYDGPLVSFVCSAYNHAKFITETINGFLNQDTDFPYEIIIHDDASTDETQDIIREYAENYPEIIKFIFQTENQFSRGRKSIVTLFGEAKGKYIAFCEGDDYWVDPQKVAKQISFLETNPDYAICYTNSIPFKDAHIVNKNYGGSLKDLSQDELQRSPNIYTLTSCFRNLVTFPPEFMMAKYGDLFLWSLLGQYGKGKYLSDITPSMYRVHAGGIHSTSSNEVKSKMAISTYSAIFTYYRRIGDKDLEEYFLNRLNDLIIVNYGLRTVTSAIQRRFKRLIRGILSY